MTLEDVARRAKVAPGTARKALRNDPSVRSYLRDRVLTAAKEMNYHPNMIARGLRQSVSMLVSLVIPGLENPYFGELAKNIIELLHNNGFESTIATSVEKVMEHHYGYRSCGCISFAALSPQESDILLTTHTLVTIQSHNYPIENVPDVPIDFSNCYRKLTNLAIDLNRSKVAFCYFQKHVDSLGKKFGIVESTLKRRNLLPFRPYSEGFTSLPELLNCLHDNPQAFDVLFCQNDIIASQCLAGIVSMGLKVPNDILIIGCDSTLPMQNIWSINVDLQQLAEHAVDFFVRLHNGEELSERALLEPVVVI